MSFEVTIRGGTSKRLPTAGKYCEQDIIIHTTDPLISDLTDTTWVIRNWSATAGYGIFNITGSATYPNVSGVETTTAFTELRIGYIYSSPADNKISTPSNDITADTYIMKFAPSPDVKNPDLIEWLCANGELQNEAQGGENQPDGIPSGYTIVDFIEFTGKQLIDTGIIGNQDTQITASFTWGNTTQNHLFGCASPDNTASITSYMNGSWRFGSKYASKTIMRNNTVLPYAVRLNKTMIGITGSSTTISDVSNFETIGTMLLGGARSSSGALPNSGLVGRVFYFNVWQGDEQVMKLVPVVSTDGVYRFWDMVSKTFFDSITDTSLYGGDL